MWMRFFCALMARLSSDKSLPLKNSLVAMCHSRYEHDQFQQEHINDFERTYDPSNMLFECRSIITDLQN